ncbi:hypothetical protein [Sphingobium ummariense]|uniref:Uncharacterized protein n=1 Tax=Sphingobium ummariense RL-3 TaxID=1346791 RepID=T0IT30_9SPHN|nr:hypothetical protein [Sphingobium ummariense]EQB32010.1 hypothetical protein M529_11740 [Sphingobium ummariense RL-3]
MKQAPCIICNKLTSAKADMEHEFGVSVISMCKSCQDITAKLGIGDHPQRRRWPSWLPRVGITVASSVGLDDADDPSIDDFEGRTLVFQWGRFAIELFIGRR